MKRELEESLTEEDCEGLIVGLMSTSIAVSDLYGDARRRLLVFTELEYPSDGDTTYKLSFNYWLDSIMNVIEEQTK